MHIGSIDGVLLHEFWFTCRFRLHLHWGLLATRNSASGQLMSSFVCLDMVGGRRPDGVIFNMFNCRMRRSYVYILIWETFFSWVTHLYWSCIYPRREYYIIPYSFGVIASAVNTRVVICHFAAMPWWHIAIDVRAVAKERQITFALFWSQAAFCNLTSIGCSCTGLIGIVCL